MTEIVLVRQNREPIAKADAEAARKVLVGQVDGLSEAHRKSWRRLWNWFLRKAEPGEMVEIKTLRPRNAKFHRKFFALLTVGFEAWEPARKRKTYKGRPIAKNFERFRKDIIILAGFYEQTFDLRGRMKLEAKSISFANMEDEEFEQVYSAVADVLLAKVLTTYKGRAELDAVVEQIMGFTSASGSGAKASSVAYLGG